MLIVKKTLTKVLQDIKTPLHVGMLTIPSQSIGANTGASGNVSIPSVTGYTPLCVCGWDISSWNVSLTRCRVSISEQKVFYSARNFTSSAVSTSIDVFVLYIKNDMA